MKLIDSTTYDSTPPCDLDFRRPIPTLRHHSEVVIPHRCMEPLAQGHILKIGSYTLGEYVGFGNPKQYTRW